MSSVATLKRKKVAEAVAVPQRPIAIPRRSSPHTAETAAKRRELAELLRSIRTMLQRSP